MAEIIVTRRLSPGTSHPWRATRPEDPLARTFGRSMAEAVGQLVFLHQHSLNVLIHVQPSDLAEESRHDLPALPRPPSGRPWP